MSSAPLWPSEIISIHIDLKPDSIFRERDSSDAREKIRLSGRVPSDSSPRPLRFALTRFGTLTRGWDKGIGLSKDLPIQRIAVSDQIQVGDGVVNGAVEAVEIDEGSVGKVTRFQIAPNDFDVVQLRGVFGQPFDGEPGALRPTPPGWPC